MTTSPEAGSDVRLLSHGFCRSEFWAQLSWVLCSESREAGTKVLASPAPLLELRVSFKLTWCCAGRMYCFAAAGPWLAGCGHRLSSTPRDCLQLRAKPAPGSVTPQRPSQASNLPFTEFPVPLRVRPTQDNLFLFNSKSAD